MRRALASEVPNGRFQTVASSSDETGELAGRHRGASRHRQWTRYCLPCLPMSRPRLHGPQPQSGYELRSVRRYARFAQGQKSV